MVLEVEVGVRLCKHKFSLHSTAHCKNKMTEPEEDENNNNGIQVYLRIRPSDYPVTYFQRDDIDLTQITVKIPKNEDIINNSRSGYNFSFSNILDDKANQKDVFRTVGIPSIRNALAGYNSTIFA